MFPVNDINLSKEAEFQLRQSLQNVQPCNQFTYLIKRCVESEMRNQFALTFVRVFFKKYFTDPMKTVKKFLGIGKKRRSLFNEEFVSRTLAPAETENLTLIFKLLPERHWWLSKIPTRQSSRQTIPKQIYFFEETCGQSVAEWMLEIFFT